MSILFQSEYRGEHHVGFAVPAEGDDVTLHRVSRQRLYDAILASGDLPALPAILAEGAPTVTVPADDPGLRLFPPLLPGAEDRALVSGFMGTHKSKPAEFDPPKWFFKGLGPWLRLPGETLAVPAAPVALIEEPEVVLVYLNDDAGVPHYAGYTFGNDLCDIGLHRRDPGYNPYCKLCDTAIAPWLFLGEPPRTVTGRTTIERDGVSAWEGDFDCGADSLHHRVADMTGNLFTYPALLRPGLVNYLLLGADKASFHDGFRIADGDRIHIDVKTHGVRLSNQVRFHAGTAGV
ncbi:hypothetical protein Acy02nite_28370 [Actinoplanes cyaneus]|uniref:Fumarylacetoacetate (FAA) hydrolase n=1 Tax=Actinoplanes cyaneus TaxID=52696 RepID=A0A919MBC1_9ACTN|nr:hypothetical protein [Actinoplanes cyaneus]MCW2137837.1 hypothetical protein [Actinoplanes cyaneus]GID64956.1 hypothetical protein Acy02nite_28370 [Actinoplanes cyaneus]